MTQFEALSCVIQELDMQKDRFEQFDSFKQAIFFLHEDLDELEAALDEKLKSLTLIEYRINELAVTAIRLLVAAKCIHEQEDSA